jgi:hypothetical protein
VQIALRKMYGERFMNEDDFEQYSMWANDELIWGRGENNWCRYYSQDEKYRTSILDDNDDIVIPF